MRALLPRTVAGWVIATVLAGLATSQLLTLAMHERERDATAVALESFHVGERIAGIVGLMQRTSPERRDELARQLDASTMWVGWGSDGTVAADSQEWHAALLKAAVDRALAPGSWRQIHVAALPRGERAPTPPPHHADVGPRHDGLRLEAIAHGIARGPSYALAIQLDDGSWLNFVAPMGGSAASWSAELIAELGLSLAVVVALSLVAIRHVTAPLRALAGAAKQFGTDIAAPDLVPRGPRELRQTIVAFNEMRGRIRRFVEDRVLMVAAISHDLRTPLTRLRLRAEFVDDDEQQAKMLADLDEMEAMIAEVLAFSREEIVVEERRPLDLAALVEEICAEPRRAEGGPALKRGGPVPVVGRPSALRRCVANLVGNARRHGESVQVTVRRAGGDAVVTIEDDGPGIPTEELERVFRPFYRLERSRSREAGGTGLGLTVARTVARSHGGDVRLENRDTGGLRAIVTLPARPPGRTGAWPSSRRRSNVTAQG